MSATRFQAKISIINGNPYVRPPDQVLQSIFTQAGKDSSPIPVKGKINSATFQQTLVRYEGDWRLYVNIIMAKAAKIKFDESITEIVGELANFELEFDRDPPVFAMVPFLREGLDNNPAAATNWKKLPPSRQKEILRYFSWLKSDEAKEHNLTKLLEVLTRKAGRFMARDWKDGA